MLFLIIKAIVTNYNIKKSCLSNKLLVITELSGIVSKILNTNVVYYGY